MWSLLRLGEEVTTNVLRPGRRLSLAGWPRMKWVVTDSKYLTKPSKDWQPHIPTANTDPAYIEVVESGAQNVS